MPFIADILKYESLSIVGTEKNTGKTECLNYILRHLPKSGPTIAVSSIGMDGERIDTLYGSSKPEITLREGTYFATTESLYAQRRIVSELLEVDDYNTALGRVVTARALSDGMVVLSGPSSTARLRRWMDRVGDMGAGLTIIDGALSRLSLAAPTVSEAMVLATGAALSSDMNRLVRETAFVVELINIPLTERKTRDLLVGIEQGLWVVDRDGKLRELGIKSSLSLSELEDNFPSDVKILYLTGALTERVMEFVANRMKEESIEIVVGDFTKVFVSSRSWAIFRERGGIVSVMNRSKLLAVCVNPTAPNGMHLNSQRLRETLSQAIALPVYDLFDEEGRG